LPTVVDLQNLTVLGAAEIALIIAVIITAVMTGYALAAARARQFFRSARAMKIVNRVCGATIAGAAVVVATR
jgi:threonine/homoserine/homoserine lactone efflux protein